MPVSAFRLLQQALIKLHLDILHFASYIMSGWTLTLWWQ